MKRFCIVTMLSVALAGCAGQHRLTVPDQLAVAGGQAPAVVRLERSEVWRLFVPVEQAPVRFKVGDGPLRAGYTNEFGYAGALVPVPQETGQYALRVNYLSSRGRAVAAEAPVYVWPEDRPVVAIDLAALPLGAGEAPKAAAAALREVAQRAGILYLTTDDIPSHEGVHEVLAQIGYPDGPVLLWRSRRWHLRRGRLGLPKLVVEEEISSRLDRVTDRFGGLEAGVCGSELGARAFAEAGLQCVVVGEAPVRGEAMRVGSWSELPQAMIQAGGLEPPPADSVE